MDIEVTDVSTQVLATCLIKLTDTPDLKADRIDRLIQPHLVKVVYAYRQTRSEDGWIEHAWPARSVLVNGRRILKPHKDGTPRLGVDVHHREWFVVSEGGLANAIDGTGPPEWLIAIIEAARPSGELFVAGKS